ncbi:MAG TPA: GAP family protein [Solirubrobacterales bacterium]|nr:GAP family protein [Solirubrobacterales bacterium]
MLSLLADILPLMLAAASNPAVISIVVLLLTASDRPLPRAIAFVAGFALVLVALGVVGLLLFRSSRETFGTGGALFAWLDIVLGVVMLAGAAVTYLRRNAATGGADRLLGRMRPAAFVGVGAAFMVTNTSAIVAYLPLLREIAIAPVSHAERAVALALSDLVIVAPIAGPVLIRLAAPRSSERALGAIRRFLDRFGYLIAIAVFGAIGGFLLIRGLVRL